MNGIQNYEIGLAKSTSKKATKIDIDVPCLHDRISNGEIENLIPLFGKINLGSYANDVWDIDIERAESHEVSKALRDCVSLIFFHWGRKSEFYQVDRFIFSIHVLLDFGISIADRLFEKIKNNKTESIVSDSLNSLRTTFETESNRIGASLFVAAEQKMAYLLLEFLCLESKSKLDKLIEPRIRGGKTSGAAKSQEAESNCENIKKYGRLVLSESTPKHWAEFKRLIDLKMPAVKQLNDLPTFRKHAKSIFEKDTQTGEIREKVD